MDYHVVNNKQINYKLLNPKKKFLLAFSGGPDSVFSLIKIYEYFYNKLDMTKDEISKHLFLCYINYHDSDEVEIEEDIVLSYANRYNLKLYKFDDYSSMQQKGNFEAKARDLRYKIFANICKEDKIDNIIVGEHFNDHIETYLLQKDRKNIVKHYGLNYVSVLNDVEVIRPLLQVTKEEIVTYLDKMNNRYFIDKTNYYNRKRNNIRKALTKESYDELSNTINRLNDDLFHIKNRLHFAISNNLENGYIKVKKNLVFLLNEEYTTYSVINRVLFDILESILPSNVKPVKYIPNLLQLIEKNEDIYHDFEAFALLQHDNKLFFLQKKHFIFGYHSNKENIYEGKIPLVKYKYNQYVTNKITFDFNENFISHFKVNLEDSYFITNILSLRTFNQNYPTVKSDLKAKDIHKLFSSLKIPMILRQLYPLVINNKNECICIPKLHNSLYLKDSYLKNLIDDLNLD